LLANVCVCLAGGLDAANRSKKFKAYPTPATPTTKRKTRKSKEKSKSRETSRQQSEDTFQPDQLQDASEKEESNNSDQDSPESKPRKRRRLHSPRTANEEAIEVDTDEELWQIQLDLDKIRIEELKQATLVKKLELKEKQILLQLRKKKQQGGKSSHKPDERKSQKTTATGKSKPKKPAVESPVMDDIESVDDIESEEEVLSDEDSKSGSEEETSSDDESDDGADLRPPGNGVKSGTSGKPGAKMPGTRFMDSEDEE